MAAAEEKLGEISLQTVELIKVATARARAADSAGDKAACEQRSQKSNARSALEA
jgi:hypothetical protein